ncbi:microsomal glutathione S-transferase 1 [Rhinophrynus dorsalis]
MAGLNHLSDNEVFLAFATYAIIVLLKMMLMSAATAYQRITKKIYANPEDASPHSKGGDIKRYLRTDEAVERIRRCHLNDIENIVPFIGVGLLYALSNPDLFTALLHFRVFTASRILHTISYLTPLPQPSRALTWFIGYLVIISMAYFALQNVLYL